MTKKIRDLDIEKLKHELHYDSASGEILRRHGDKLSGIYIIGKPMKLSTDRKGYKKFCHAGLSVSAHRIAWVLYHGKFPDGQIDHKNGDPADNRIENLRDVTHLENCHNLAMRPRNKSGVIGVHWFKQSKKWMAKIKYHGRTIYLGTFDNIADAAAVRREAEIRFGFHENHGRPARIIFHLGTEKSAPKKSTEKSHLS